MNNYSFSHRPLLSQRRGGLAVAIAKAGGGGILTAPSLNHYRGFVPPLLFALRAEKTGNVRVVVRRWRTHQLNSEL